MSEKKVEKKDISRRQFLTYMLTGVGGFLAAGISVPFIPFVLDPALKTKASGNEIEIGPSVDFDKTWKTIQFNVKVKDGWYETEEKVTAFARIVDDKPMVISAVCTHLGCTVSWASKDNTTANGANEFFCPCHFGRYDENGVNISPTPPRTPLEEYPTSIKDGKLVITGNRQKRGGA